MPRHYKPSDDADGKPDLGMVSTVELINELKVRGPAAVICLLSVQDGGRHMPLIACQGEYTAQIGMLELAKSMALGAAITTMRPIKDGEA